MFTGQISLQLWTAMDLFFNMCESTSVKQNLHKRKGRRGLMYKNKSWTKAGNFEKQNKTKKNNPRVCIVLKCILEKINDTLPWLNNSSLWKFQRILRRLEGEKMKICLTVLTELLLCIFFNLQSLFKLAKVIFWGNLTNIIRWWQHISPNVLSAGTCFSQPIGLQPCSKDD